MRPSRAADGAVFLEERAAAVGALQGEAEAPGDDGRLRVPEGHAAERKVVYAVTHTWASNGFFGGARGGDTVNKGSYVIK